MRQEWREVLERFYEETGDEGWWRCQTCGAKVHAGETEYSDFLVHEKREHPER